MTTIQIKRSSTPNTVPSNTDIVEGELALNLADRKLFSSDGEEVFEIGGSSGGNSNVIISLPQNDIRTEEEYEITLDDQGKHLYASNNTIEIPRHDDISFPIGTTITIVTDPIGNTSTIKPKEYETGNSTLVIETSRNYSSDWGLPTGKRADLLKIEEDKWLLSAPIIIDTLDVPSSITFPETTSRLKFFQDPDFHVINGDFTIEMFYRQTTTLPGGGYNKSLFRILHHPFTAERTISIDINNWESRIEVLFDNSVEITLSINSFTVGQWFHVALTREEDDLRLFLNGTLVGSNTVSNSLRTESLLLLGSGQFENDSDNLDFGQLTNFHIVKGTALYTSGFTPPSQPLEPHEDSKLLLKFQNKNNILKNDAGPDKIPDIFTDIEHLSGISPWT